MTWGFRCQCSGFRILGLAFLTPETRNLYKLSACLLPIRDTFSERRLRKSLVPIYSNHIIFAHDLCHSQIEYLSNSIDLNKKDRAKPPARRGFSAYASESDNTNLQFRLVRVGISCLQEKILQLFCNVYRGKSAICQLQASFYPESARIQCCVYLECKLFRI